MIVLVGLWLSYCEPQDIFFQHKPVLKDWTKMSEHEQRHARAVVEEAAHEPLPHACSLAEIRLHVKELSDKVQTAAYSLGFEDSKHKGNCVDCKLAACSIGMVGFWSTHISGARSLADFTVAAAKARYSAGVLQSAFAAEDPVRTGVSFMNSLTNNPPSFMNSLENNTVESD